MFRVGISLAVLSQGVDGLRRGKTEEVAGVPIKNYRYRHLQVAAAGAEADTFDWIVKFKNGVQDPQLVQFCGGECSSMGHPSLGGIPLATVRATEKQLEQMLAAHPGVAEFVEPDSPVFTEAVVETARNAPWGHANINLPSAQFTGRGTHIYVMDTGIRTTHLDFGGRGIPTVDTIAGGGSVRECDPSDTTCAADGDGHGTHVAGTAGGLTFGVAKEAALHAMKVCCGGGTNINGGMDWIAQFAQKPAVMTMSLGSYTTPESSRVAVDAVVNSGVTVTVSAGNRGSDSCLKSYTFIASAIGVGSSTSTNARSGFSNFGTCNAIFAPGSSILSASHRSDSGSATMSGTSMAAPHVAGAAALLLEEDPTLVAGEGVRAALRARATANVLTGLQTGDPNLLLNVGVEGGPTTPRPTLPPPPTPAPGTWTVTGSGCQIDGACVQSNNYPQNYGNDESCIIDVGNLPIAVEYFETERSYDELTVNGVAYSGTPSNINDINGVQNGKLSWASDYSVTKKGWRICRTD